MGNHGGAVMYICYLYKRGHKYLLTARYVQKSANFYFKIKHFIPGVVENDAFKMVDIIQLFVEMLYRTLNFEFIFSLIQRLMWNLKLNLKFNVRVEFSRKQKIFLVWRNSAQYNRCHCSQHHE